MRTDDCCLTSRLNQEAGDGKESASNHSTPMSTADNDSDRYLGEKAAGRKRLTQWETGVIYAALNGVLAGSLLVPLHYAKLEGFSHSLFVLHWFDLRCCHCKYCFVGTSVPLKNCRFTQ